MTLEYAEWGKILSSINVQSDLDENNIVGKIKRELERTDQSTYKNWKNDQFNINHLFTLHCYDLQNEYTLLHLTIFFNKINILKALLTGGAKVDEKDDEGSTPLHLAARRRHAEAIEVLIEAGADPNSQRKGKTPLHLAARMGYTGAVKALLTGGAKVDEKDNEGLTSLHWAIQHHRGEVARLLIAREVKLKGSEAQKSNYIELSDYIELSEYWDKCLGEVKKMQKKKIDGNITFYDILTSKDDNKLARYIRNKNILKVLEESDYKSEFLMYAGEIENQYQKGIKRENLLNEGTVRIQNSDIGDKLPKEICRKVAEYLSNIDIQKLNDSASVFRKPS